MYRPIGLVIASLALAGALHAQGLPKFGRMEQEQTIGGQGKGMTLTTSIYWKANKVRIESRSPLGDRIVIFDGSTTYIYMPAMNTAVKEKQKLDLATLSKTMTQQVGNLKKGKKVGTQKILGYPCDIYTGSDAKSKATYKVWIMQGATGIPLKATVQSSQGNMSLNVKKLDLKNSPKDSLFQLPKGAKIQEAPQGGMGMPGGIPQPPAR